MLYFSNSFQSVPVLVLQVTGKIKDLLRKDCHYKETIKTLETKNDALSNASSDFQLMKARHRRRLDSKDLFYLQIRQKGESQKILFDSLSGESVESRNRRISENDISYFQQRTDGVPSISNHLCNDVGEERTVIENHLK
ncbi:hypothetical protein AVEN_88975-1 [Araneus ventricosus]|uniref:Uncharacterized protein n=1 Tax=Araneus ventricosus TaxID=182803 RepID=A0A4Y2DIK3_ARAVE|nr:hypothetical protein AVEN_88975-1 [Araneus ventricosus]